MFETTEKYKFTSLIESTEKKLPRAVLYQETLREKLLQSYSIDQLQTYLSSWNAIQLISTRFGYFESQTTTFTGCYFEEVKWLTSSLKDTKFINCVFRNCEWQLEPHSEVLFQECIFENTKLPKLETIIYKNCMLPKPQEVPQQQQAEKVTPVAIPKPAEVKQPENSRFKILER